MRNDSDYRPIVKVCGLTNIEDARLASDLSADLLGVVLDPEVARHGDEDLVGRMRSLGKDVVGVYTSMDSVRSSELKEDIVQLHFAHGKQEIEEVRFSLGKKVISVIQVHEISKAFAEAIEAHDAGADFILLEKKDGIAEILPRIEILLRGYDVGVSGKIDADSLDVLVPLKPSFIDLSSSLESAPGKKDPAKMREFFLKLGRLRVGS
ncbi:MAG: phosphoribosylanthranilate isomerase [Candidatus Thermoplasmatota archaeon]|jgi:phosphoribosylanthranilate isomerase|nr:phosphoribosylanthranilate isomerase [Candidatus Thermoplasmatota archaeon]